MQSLTLSFRTRGSPKRLMDYVETACLGNAEPAQEQIAPLGEHEEQTSCHEFADSPPRRVKNTTASASRNPFSDQSRHISQRTQEDRNAPGISAKNRVRRVSSQGHRARKAPGDPNVA